MYVICEDDTANYENNWMVISERCDNNIMETTSTDDNGRLLCEVENTDTHFILPTSCRMLFLRRAVVIVCG